MNKRRLRITLKLLEMVKERFPNTINLIDNKMEEQCQEEKISMEEVILAKIFVCVLSRLSLPNVFQDFLLIGLIKNSFFKNDSYRVLLQSLNHVKRNTFCI